MDRVEMKVARGARAPQSGQHWHRAAVLLALLGTVMVAATSSVQSESLQAVGDAAAPIEYDYVGVGKCKSCHAKELMGDQLAAWRLGPHQSGLAVLETEAALRVAEERGLTAPPKETPECLSCHVTGYGIAAERFAYPVDPADGVQCESCHGPGRSYRKKKIMSDLERAQAKGLWNPSEDHAICLRCHNSQSPTYDPGRFTLADGRTTDFDYSQAVAQVVHPIPEDVKGHYLELDKERKDALKEDR